MQRRTKPLLLAASGLLAIALSACGSLNGDYEPRDGGFFERITFHGDGKVDITFMGMTKQGTYEQDGERVTISVGGETQVFTLNREGCVEGGAMLGTYCKGEKGEKDEKGEKGGLSGRYEAEDADGRLTLEFRGGNQVRFTMAESGAPPGTADGQYTVNGNTVVVQMPGGMPLQLTRSGNALEGAFMGETIRFIRK